MLTNNINTNHFIGSKPIIHTTNNSDTSEDKKVSWNAEKIEEALERIEQGYKLKTSPFYEGDKIHWRRGEIAYEYNQHELNEIKKCKRSVIYFANNYCQLMTENGYQPIILRPYQEEMVTNFQKYKSNIVLSSRQIGKCLTYVTKLNVIRGRFTYNLYCFLDKIKNKCLKVINT